MSYAEKLEFIENLGWKVYETWANRDFYALEGMSSKFYLVEHNGSWSIGRGDDYYYIEDPTVEEIAEYTEIAKNYFKIVMEPEAHTVKELMDSVDSIDRFYKKCELAEEERFDF